MISALLVALREGFEAALIVGIVLVYLNKTGRRALAGYVWWGLGAAGACSVVAAILLDRWRISEDGFEGLMMLAAAVLVVTMIVWMNRIARSLRKEIEERVEVYAQRSSRAAGLGIFLFVFSMVLREGAELVLILRAVELSTSGILVWIGTGVGILIAAGVGLFFFQGTLRIPLGRFFKVTSAILIVVAVQLAITGLHELSEAQWIWSSKREMATIGPIVRNEFFFFVIILGVAGFSVIQQWFASRTPVYSEDVNPAERRRREWQFRKQRRWSFAAATLCLVVMIMFAAEFVYARSSLGSPSAESLQAQNGQVQIRISTVEDGKLHFFTADVSGTVLRFIVVKKGEGDYVTALDACQICGWAGYKQDGQNVICRNCGSAIYIPSIGQAGGCNPVAVKSSIQGGTITVDLSALAYSASSVH